MRRGAVSLLQRVRTPADLRALAAGEVDSLAAEIRGFLVDKVCRTGGHLGPNLGVVELTLALHRVFDSPRDALVFDTGHQSYVHKIVTGRSGEFDGLRQGGGLSGYPSRAESEHDHVENSHASTAISWVDGLAKADALLGRKRSVVAVVGDGALTGGMCWEALNNVAGSDRPVVIVVNDNGRSYAPTTGGLSERLSTLRLAPRYEEVLEHGKRALQKLPVVGGPLYSAMHAAKAGVKDAFTPQALFSDLGIKYVGPVDGHDVEALETALSAARDFGAPVIVHAVTYKGRGFPSAEQDQADQMHSVGVLDPDTGLPVGPKPREWTAVFTESMLELGGERSDLVAITAAMPGPTGLSAFGEAYPERLFDVGYRRGARHDLGGGARPRRPAPGGRDLLDVPQPRLRPAAHGRGAAPRAGDGRARPRRGHRQRRREPQRHVGPLGHGDRPRPAGGGAARRGDAARGAARGGRDLRRSHGPALVQGRGAQRGARAAPRRSRRHRRDRRTGRGGRARRAGQAVPRRTAAHGDRAPRRRRDPRACPTCCSSPSAASASSGSRPRTGSPRRGSA